VDSDSVRRRAERATARFGRRTGSAQPGSVAAYRAGAYAVARVEATARTVLNAEDILPMRQFWYLSFARAVAKLFGRYAAKTYAYEVESLVMRWERRGLERAVLLKVADAVTTELAEESISASVPQDPPPRPPRTDKRSQNPE
jgi:hypothetical protein